MSRFLITGHTGFKGSWLAHRLVLEGHEVAGYALPPESESHYVLAETGSILSFEKFGSILDFESFDRFLSFVRPDRVIHLAAQPIVSVSYHEPQNTIAINVEGTNKVLEGVVKNKIPRVLVVTSDKVYKDIGDRVPRSEESPLGGYDPYSASKAAADLIAQSWMNIQKVTDIRVVRGGNVIGGGDRGKNRLIPDFERAVRENTSLTIRNPIQTRPWQHVLDCLDGYLRVLEAENVDSQPKVWNIGPSISASTISVERLLEIYAKYRGKSPEIEFKPSEFKETQHLSIDCSRVQTDFGWSTKMSPSMAIRKTAEWECQADSSNYHDGAQDTTPKDMTDKQISEYLHQDICTQS